MGIGIKKLFCIGLVSLGALAAAFVVSAEPAIEQVEVSQVWARPTIGQVRNSAAYFTLENSSEQSDRLLSASGDVAERIELHTHIMDGEVMLMRQVEGGVAVPAGESVMFEPGGLHVMMMGLIEPLNEGDDFPLTLNFEGAGAVQINVPVRKSSAAAGHEQMDHDKMDHSKMKHDEMQ